MTTMTDAFAAVTVVVYAILAFIWWDERRAKKVGRKARSLGALNREKDRLVRDVYREQGR